MSGAWHGSTQQSFSDSWKHPGGLPHAIWPKHKIKDKVYNVLGTFSPVGTPRPCWLVPGEIHFTYPTHWKKGHLVHALGMFSSVSQAMKNGWRGDLTHTPGTYDNFLVVSVPLPRGLGKLVGVIEITPTGCGVCL